MTNAQKIIAVTKTITIPKLLSNLKGIMEIKPTRQELEVAGFIRRNADIALNLNTIVRHVC